MGQSKRYKGKACAYCRQPGTSSTNDHVIARAFFLEEDRSGLPQIPACAACNIAKSKLEGYVAATLMMASEHPEGDRYRQEKVRPRLLANAKLRDELKLDAPFEWVRVNGVLQQMKAVRIDATQVSALMRVIVLGLYRHHFGAPLPTNFLVDVKMYPPEREAGLLAGLASFFPAWSPAHAVDLGRGSFVYAVRQSPGHAALTLWQLAWHGGIRLHGLEQTSADSWWAVTRPSPEAVALAQSDAADAYSTK